jgi:signal transduction histidine kinase
MVSGVAAGLAGHLGVRVKTVRWALAISVFAAGAGALLYVWLWLTVPAGAADGAAGAGPPAFARLIPALREPSRRGHAGAMFGGAALVTVAALLIASRQGADIRWEWIVPAAAMAGGVALAWSQLEKADAGTRSQPSSPVSVVRLVAAVGLLIVGIALLMWNGEAFSNVTLAILGGVAMVAAVVVVLAPWWLRLLRALGDERAARARESERADIAAHLHDSVLQTLAVMRSRAEDPEAVRRLARAQERELRAWLYQDRTAPGASLAAALRTVIAEVEDGQGVEVGTVIVGDAAPCPATEALAWALREALLNAARHGAPPISVYVEVSERGIEAFVRDHGPGFDLGSVPEDRLGVRESIIGRMVRQGGWASVEPAAGAGVEVRLGLPPAAMGGVK